MFLPPSGVPNSVNCWMQGGPSGSNPLSDPSFILNRSFADIRSLSAKDKNCFKVKPLPSSFKAYRVVCLAFWYGRLIKFPTSPLSARTSSCLGNISQFPQPKAEENSASLSRTSEAGIFSDRNKNRWAPPDFDRQTTSGSLNLLTLDNNAMRSRL